MKTERTFDLIIDTATMRPLSPKLQREYKCGDGVHILTMHTHLCLNKTTTTISKISGTIKLWKQTLNQLETDLTKARL